MCTVSFDGSAVFICFTLRFGAYKSTFLNTNKHFTVRHWAPRAFCVLAEHMDCVCAYVCTLWCAAHVWLRHAPWVRMCLHFHRALGRGKEVGSGSQRKTERDQSEPYVLPTSSNTWTMKHIIHICAKWNVCSMILDKISYGESYNFKCQKLTLHWPNHFIWNAMSDSLF